MDNMLDSYFTAATATSEASTKQNMRTRGNTKIPFSECTEFTLHVSQKSEFSKNKRNLIDYTEHKLRRYILTVTDKQQALVLNVMLTDYIQGNIAVAWRKGQPVYIKITKE
jgi:hypothetical protein